MILVALAAFGADSPFTGIWKLNLQRSKLPPPLPRSETLHIEGDTKSIRIRQEGIDDQGKAFGLRVSADFGGKDFGVLNSRSVDTVRLDHRNSRTISVEGLKSGLTVVTGTAVVSRDSKTLKFEFSIWSPDDRETKAVASFDRQPL